MILTVIGSGTAVPSVERGSPCYHLAAGGMSLVFDLGSGSVRQLWKEGIDVRMIDVIAFSHFHPDHTADLVPLLFALGNPEFGRDGEMLLVGPPGLRKYVTDLQGIYGDWIRPPGLRLHVREIGPEKMKLGGVTLSAALSGHTAKSLAFRVENRGKSLVYGGDSVVCDSLIGIARQANLLVLESSFPEGTPCRGHMTPSWAAGVAAEAEAKKLLLTHFYPAADTVDCLPPARKMYEGEVLLATDGLRLEV